MNNKMHHQAAQQQTSQQLLLASNNDFRCCLCFHVRTGAMIIGIWHMIVNSMLLVLFVSMMVHPEVKDQFSSWTFLSNPSSSTNPPDNDSVGAPHSHDLSGGASSGYSFVKEACTQDIPVGILITICMGGITALLLFGTIKGRANCLMPFFCVQIFDFVVSALTAVGYFSYMPNVRRWIEHYKDIPLQKELLALDPQWLCALVMVAFIIYMVVKSYMMGIVWSCYKYLKFQQMARLVETYIDVDAEALLAPDYDLIAKMPPPPPPYKEV